MAEQTDRRSFLKKSALGISGVAAVSSLEERSALAAMQQGTTITPEQREAAGKEPMPYGQIGNVKISRLIMGSNLIGGYAHSRDLLYVSQLFKQYNTDEKILDTFELGEQLGVNTLLTSPPSLKYLQMYNKQRGGKLQAVVYIRPSGDPDHEHQPDYDGKGDEASFQFRVHCYSSSSPAGGKLIPSAVSMTSSAPGP